MPRRKSIIALILLCFGLIIFLFSYNVFWLGDDIFYMYIIRPFCDDTFATTHEPIQTFKDVIQSQNSHYFIFNGRYIVHMLVQLYCGLWGQTAFAVANALAWIIFVLMIISSADKSPSNTCILLFTIIAASVSFSTKMVPTTQIGYIWMGIIIMSFITIYFVRGGWKWYTLAPAIVLSLIAGASHEAFVVGVGGSLFIYLLLNYRYASTAQWILFVFFSLGACFLCLAPSNLTRAGGHNANMFMTLVTLATSLRATYLLIIVLLIARFHYKVSLSAIYRDNYFLFNIVEISLLFNLAIGVYCNRQLFGCELFSLILSLKILPAKAFRMGWIAPLCVILGLFWCMQFSDVKALHSQKGLLFEKYPKSADGEAYIPLHSMSLVKRHVSYIEQLPTYSRHDYSEDFLSGYMSQRFPDVPPLKIIPDCLKGMDTVDLGNRIFHYPDNAFVLVQSVSDPATFTESRSIGIGLLRKHYDRFAINLRNPIKETQKWKAYIITNDMLLTQIDSITMSSAK